MHTLVWTIPKREFTKIKIDSSTYLFLKRFNEKLEELKKSYKGKQMTSVKTYEELQDFLRIYTETQKYLIKEEQDSFEKLTRIMKKYLNARDKSKNIADSIQNLKEELSRLNNSLNDEEEEDHDQ